MNWKRITVLLRPTSQKKLRIFRGLNGNLREQNTNLASEYLRVPMVGCASHRLNLAVKQYLKPHEDLLMKIQSLMKKFFTGKQRALLRKKTHLPPVLRCTTRWSGDFNLLSKLFEITPFLNPADPDLVDFILLPKEDSIGKKIMEHLGKINCYHEVTRRCCHSPRCQVFI